MKQVILNIPNKDYKFFLDLINHMPGIKLSADEKDLVITDKMKKMLDDRLNFAEKNQDKLISWETVSKNIKKQLKK